METGEGDPHLVGGFEPEALVERSAILRCVESDPGNAPIATPVDDPSHARPPVLLRLYPLGGRRDFLGPGSCEAWVLAPRWPRLQSVTREGKAKAI